MSASSSEIRSISRLIACVASPADRLATSIWRTGASSAPWIETVALGSGLPLFKDLTTPLPLTLVSATTYPDGTAIHVYRPRTP